MSTETISKTKDEALFLLIKTRRYRLRGVVIDIVIIRIARVGILAPVDKDGIFALPSSRQFNQARRARPELSADECAILAASYCNEV